MPEEPVLSTKELALLADTLLEAIEAIESGDELADTLVGQMQLWVDTILDRIMNTEGDA